jgi:plasmid stabilization system protein ParE
MMRVIRSAQANRDMIEVLAYTKQRWGVAQAREY